MTGRRVTGVTLALTLTLSIGFAQSVDTAAKPASPPLFTGGDAWLAAGFAVGLVAFAPYDAPRYALSVVVEHGNAGAAAAGPIARDIMLDTLQRDPAERDALPGAQVAEREKSR